MTFDKKDWAEKQRERRQQAQSVGQAHRPAMPPQAAVAAEALMSEPHWRVFQQMLQGSIERMEATLRTLEYSLRLPQDAVSMAKIQCEIARCEGAIHALNAAIMLPKQISENARNAEETPESAVNSIAGETANAAG